MSHLTQPVSEQDHYLGPPHVPTILLEYGDYECPFCGRAHLVVKEVMRSLRGQLGYVFRHFPLSNMHPNAELAAEAAEAAGAQGRFWEMHDALYANQERLGPGQIEVLARELRLDTERFVREVNDRVYRERVRRDFMSGVRSGVNGTPTFFINGARFDGSWDADTLTTVLRATLHAERGPAQHRR